MMGLFGITIDEEEEKKKARKLLDMDITEISLVERGATGLRFYLKKEELKKMENMINLFKQATISEEEITGFLERFKALPEDVQKELQQSFKTIEAYRDAFPADFTAALIKIFGGIGIDANAENRPITPGVAEILDDGIAEERMATYKMEKDGNGNVILVPINKNHDEYPSIQLFKHDEEEDLEEEDNSDDISKKVRSLEKQISQLKKGHTKKLKGDDRGYTEEVKDDYPSIQMFG